jgi:uncharacterized membrane protein YiaA
MNSHRVFAFSAALVSAWTNLLLYLVGYGLGIFNSLQFSPRHGGEPAIGPMLIVSFSIPLVAFLVFDRLNRNDDSGFILFQRSALLALSGLALMPVTIAHWSAAQILVIELMHIVVGACTLYHLGVWNAER